MHDATLRFSFMERRYGGSLGDHIFGAFRLNIISPGMKRSYCQTEIFTGEVANFKISMALMMQYGLHLALEKEVNRIAVFSRAPNFITRLTEKTAAVLPNGENSYESVMQECRVSAEFFQRTVFALDNGDSLNALLLETEQNYLGSMQMVGGQVIDSVEKLVPLIKVQADLGQKINSANVVSNMEEF